jgi:dephospho-CoA kinase
MPVVNCYHFLEDQIMPLENTLFIGGSPCAGKSTVCDLFAQKHGFAQYHCDEHYQQHLERTKDGQTLKTFQDRSWQQAMSRPLEVMIADELQANRELGEFALEDLLRLEGATMAEGMPFMPDLMASFELQVEPVYFVPTPSFQREHYAKREWAWKLLEQTQNPKETFERWMSRDSSTANQVKTRARDLGFAVLEVDGSLTMLETLHWLEQQFNFLARLPNSQFPE